MINTMNRISQFFHHPAAGLLLLRVVIGLIFIHHGWLKLGNISGTMGFMSAIGLAGFMAYAIIFVEIVGGVMLVLGVLTRVAAATTGIAMIVAVTLATYPHRGLAGSEFELLLMATSFCLAFIGAGKYRLLNTFEHD